MAGFQLSIYGRFWVSTEALPLDAHVKRGKNAASP